MAKVAKHRVKGSGMVREEYVETVFDMTTPSTDAEIAEIFNGIKAASERPLWDKERIVRWASAWLEELRKNIEPGQDEYCWQPHDDWGWYCGTLILRDRHVRECIAKGDAAMAAFWADDFASTFTELRIRLKSEDVWRYGQLTAEQRSDGGKATRKRSDGERLERWRHFYSIVGKKTEADRLAAEELGEGESTIRKARANAAAASD